MFLDGEVRSKASRRFRDLFYAIASDLGGMEHLSTGQMQLARRAAMISVTCEEMEQASVSGKEFDVNTWKPDLGDDADLVLGLLAAGVVDAAWVALGHALPDGVREQRVL